jgi:hypothetical protein
VCSLGFQEDIFILVNLSHSFAGCELKQSIRNVCNSSDFCSRRFCAVLWQRRWQFYRHLCHSFLQEGEKQVKVSDFVGSSCRFADRVVWNSFVCDQSEFFRLNLSLKLVSGFSICFDLYFM